MRKIFIFDVDGVLIYGYHARPELRVCWDLDLEKDFGIERELFSEKFIRGVFVREVLIGRTSLEVALNEFLQEQRCQRSASDLITYWLEKELKLDSDVKPVFFDDTPAVITAAARRGWKAYEYSSLDSLERVLRALE